MKPIYTYRAHAHASPTYAHPDHGGSKAVKPRIPRRSSLLLAIALLMSLSGATFADEYHDWMNDNWDTIKDRPLSGLVIPGTHDSGAYDLSFGDSAWAESIKEILNSLPLDLAQGYARTQSQTIYEQLMSGARILDLRFEEMNLPPPLQDFRIHHSYLGPSYEKIFSDIKKFLQEDGHQREIIVLRFSSMQTAIPRGELNDDGKFVLKKSMSSAAHRKFIRFILEEFGPYMMPEDRTVEAEKTEDDNPNYGFKVTPSKIVEEGKQLIVIYEGTSGADKAASLNNLETTQQEMGTIDFLSVCPRGDDSLPIGEENLPECEKLFWTNAQGNRWFSVEGILGDSRDGEGYPAPFAYNGSQKLENYWLRNVFTRWKGELTAAPKPHKASVTSLAFGLDTPGNDLGIPFMIANSDWFGSPFLGFTSLEEAAAYTNPRVIPHLIALPRSEVNFVSVDYFQSSGLVEEAIKLNNNPARVSVRIKSVQLTSEIDQCGPGSGVFLGIGDEDCDMYPNLVISEGTDITEVGNEEENFQISVPDQNNVYRNSHFPAPWWSTTRAISWDSAENLTFRIQIWDDDSPLGQDALITVSHIFEPGYLANVEPLGCAEEYDIENDTENGILQTDDYTILAPNDVKVVYDYVVQQWNDEMDTGCANNSEWITPGDMEITTDPGESTAVVNYEVTPPTFADSDRVLIEFMCSPVSGTAFPVGATLINCSADYLKIDEGDFSKITYVTSFNVSVTDDERPELVLPADVTTEATGGMTPVDIGTASAVDNVNGILVATNDAPDAFPLGTTIVTWTATDEAGNTASAQQVVTIVDTTPPTIESLSATPSVLWSPNKKMRPVSVAVDVNDLVDDSPSCELVDIQVNQSTPPGKKRGSLYEITGSTSALLLADRNGSGGDRRYTLRVSCSDFSGNASSATTDVVVPHDRRAAAESRRR